MSLGSSSRISGAYTSTQRRSGHYNGIVVFVKFVQSQTQSLTLSRDELLELKLVRPFLPRDASAERGDATRQVVCLSVRPSVRDDQVS